MNTLLIFFAFPIAVIIFSIVLQKLLHNPFAVSSLIFAVFVVITFAAFDQNFLIATLAYTILSFITALLTDRINNSSNNSCSFCNQNPDSTTCLCNALTNALENSNNNTNAVIDGLLDILQKNNNNNSDNTKTDNDENETCNTNTKSTTTIPNDDNVLSNNCGYMYNRRCRRF